MDDHSPGHQGMLSLELLNTAIERVVDLATEEYHPLAKQAKDIAAGAVLVYAIVSVIIGGVILLPKILIFCSNVKLSGWAALLFGISI